mmetsp:Transcript_30277/g.59481  ORF Transcript_30277/g.59481 Transcript_30277/m.59481 type:complete len:102 (-) Transcript_30277:502-807(-)
MSGASKRERPVERQREKEKNNVTHTRALYVHGVILRMRVWKGGRGTTNQAGLTRTARMKEERRSIPSLHPSGLRSIDRSFMLPCMQWLSVDHIIIQFLSFP